MDMGTGKGNSRSAGHLGDNILCCLCRSILANIYFYNFKFFQKKQLRADGVKLYARRLWQKLLNQQVKRESYISTKNNTDFSKWYRVRFIIYEERNYL